ncbi:MAG: sigma factor-like helix-turn-helix DNA-binding protein [Acutalibacter sp.]|jgi:transposase
MGRLTDKQRKEMISDRAEGMSYRQLAERYGTSVTTVKRTLAKNPEVSQKVTQKKESNTADILAHMDEKRDTVNEIIDKALDVLNDKEKLSRTGPMQLATMLGIVIDKFTGTRAAVEKLKAEAAKTKGADPMAVEDDPITKALKEELHGPQ